MKLFSYELLRLRRKVVSIEVDVFQSILVFYSFDDVIGNSNNV